MAAKIRTGDTVIAIAGREFGQTGVVESVDTGTGRAVVTGLNISIRHQRQTQDQPGGRLAKNMPIDMSNLAIVDPEDHKPTRVGFRVENGKKIRYSKRTGARIDG